MKQRTSLVFFALLISVWSHGLNPYFGLGEYDYPMDKASEKIQNFLTSNNYKILGFYQVGNDENKQVIVFTNNTLKSIALKYTDRGGLAIAQKIGLFHKNGKTNISMVNPEYLFYAYFQDGFDKNASSLKQFSNTLKAKLKENNYSLTPFGGNVDIDDLKEYQYMMGMPEFTDPVTLKKFNSFDEGIKTIQKNLAAKIGKTQKVYEYINKEKSIAVFGIGLADAENGEKYFLPIIGETHLAAMPYEIILQGNKATMLHGRFRFALHWPELTMGTFTKIMSTPGYVEETLEALTE